MILSENSSPSDEMVMSYHSIKKEMVAWNTRNARTAILTLQGEIRSVADVDIFSVGSLAML
jgi:hypothetical protein